MNSSGERRATPSSFLIKMSTQTRMLSGHVHREALCGGCKCPLPGQQEAALTPEYVWGGYLKLSCWVWIKASCWELTYPAGSRGTPSALTDIEETALFWDMGAQWCSLWLPSYRPWPSKSFFSCRKRWVSLYIIFLIFPFPSVAWDLIASKRLCVFPVITFLNE